MLFEETPGAAAAHLGGPDILHGHHDGHFLPPFFLIGTIRIAPYQTTLGARMSRVPNRTGISRPSSAVGVLTSLMPGGGTLCGFGAKAMAMASELTKVASIPSRGGSWRERGWQHV